MYLYSCRRVLLIYSNTACSIIKWRLFRVDEYGYIQIRKCLVEILFTFQYFVQVEEIIHGNEVSEVVSQQKICEQKKWGIIH